MSSFYRLFPYPLFWILLQVFISPFHQVCVNSLTLQSQEAQTLAPARLLLQQTLADNQALESLQSIAMKNRTNEENVDQVQTASQATSKLETFSLKYTAYLQKYKPKNIKQPNNEIYKYRESVYLKNIKTINQNNAKPKASFLMEPNLFTDIDQEQFKNQYLKFNIPEAEIKIGQEQADKIRDNNNGKLVYSTPRRINVDWSCKASPVISQGSCGATFAISVLQAIQITFKIYNQTVSYLSIQQILSCSSEKKDGCKSGYFTSVFDYVEKKGIGQNPSYYYDVKARQSGVISNCNIAVVGSTAYKKYKVFIKDSKRVKFGDCKQVVNILLSRSLAVGIAGEKLQFYGSGKFVTSSEKINHAVTLVGYSPEKGYRIKNSWQRSWGIDGYAYVSERVGICNYAYYPILNKETDKVSLCSEGKRR